jgi:putative acetyltransferase
MQSDQEPLFRPSEPSDLLALLAVHHAAFGQPMEVTLVESLFAGGFDRLSWVAEVEGGVVGHVLFTELNLRSAKHLEGSASLRALGLAPLAVLPEFQRRGIGSGLVKASIAQARDQGWRLVFVVGDPAYYGRFGFRAENASSFECVFACDAFMALPLHEDAVVEGALTYPAPFADLE